MTMSRFWLFITCPLQNRRPIPPARGSIDSGLSLAPYSGDLPDHFKIALPALSPTMEMGTIVSWAKKEGDELNDGDLLCEIETDKATMGFDVPEEGYLAKIFLPAGSKDIPIGRLLCIIVNSKEDVEKFKDFEDDGSIAGGAKPPPAPAQEAPAAAPAAAAPAAAAPKAAPAAAVAPPPPRKDGPKAFASPAAKRVAQEKGIDLSQITKGSGMDGMITSKDVEAFTPAPGAAAAAVGGAAPSMRPVGGLPGAGFTDADLSSMRKTIAKRLQASKLEIPHYYLTVECEMDAVMALRADINKQYEKEGVKLSVNDFIIKATALACRRVPECNSAWMETAIREFHTCDVSVAVDTGSGLITPIVTGAESRGLADISETVKELAGRAKEGRLQPHEFQGGTITVSNLGMFGIEHFTAIINPPQSCILAIGGTVRRAVPTADGGVQGKNFMKVTLSCDHR